MKKRIIIIFLVLLVLSIICLIVFNSSYSSLSEVEQYSLDCAKDYKTKLKNPESLQLIEIRYTDKSENGEFKYLIFMDISAQNSFGGYTRNIVYYYVDSYGDISYVGNDSKKDNKVKTTSSYEESLEIKIAKNIYTSWNLYDEEENKVDVDKIKRSMLSE